MRREKVKRKPTCRDDEIICLIEVNEKKYFDEQVKKFGSKQKREVGREFTAKVNSLGVALRTEDDLNKRGKILNLRTLNALRDQGKVCIYVHESRPTLYADIIMNTIGEGTYMTTGIDGEYSYLFKRMITVCGVCCTFKCHRIMYYS